MKENTKWLLGILFAVAFILWALLAPNVVSYNVVEASSVYQIMSEEISSGTPVKDELDLYIDRLADEYECINCPDNFRILDVNNKYSYGCLQFQEATFIGRVKDYNLLPSAEDEEILNMIYDCDFQKTVARRMFENEPQAYMAWYTSIVVRGLGLPPNRG